MISFPFPDKFLILFLIWV